MYSYFFPRKSAWHEPWTFSQKKICILFSFLYTLASYFIEALQNMSKDDKIEVEGKILKSLPGAIFEVQLPEEFSNMIIRAYVSGKMQKHLIRLIPWDTVTVELTPYDLSRGRITFRKPNANAPQRTPWATQYRR